jgi:voltage-gated potassium channel
MTATEPPRGNSPASPTMPRFSLQARAYRAIYGATPSGLSRTQRILAALIVASVITTVVGTETAVVVRWPSVFALLEAFFAAVFVLEYLVRLWVVGAEPRFAGILGRVRYMVTPLALLDLAAIVPFALGIFGAESLVLRVARLLRLVVLAKFARFSTAIQLLANVIYSRRFELGFTALVGLSVVLVSSSVLYVLEGELQPEAFGSIPRAAWWAVATLTTVGYGDVVPQTGLGRLFGAITALAGVGLIAMPTGILAAALSDALRRARRLPPNGSD